MIRCARPEDAEAIARIFRESRAEAMPWLPVVHTPDEDVAFFRGALGGEAFVYELDGAPAGFAIVRDDELTALYVAAESQSSGIGAALFRCAQQARPDGFSFWVFRDNTRARRFYESHGARFLYETEGAGNEERTPDARYEWRPTPAAAAG